MSKITGKTKMCVIIGDPVDHSLSPKMHNAAYEKLGIDDKFVFVASNVNIEKVEEVVEAVRVMGIRGLTCTIPHKMEVMKYLDEIDPVAAKIGAVNTVVNTNGKLKGYNTDWLGTIIPLEKLMGVGGLKDKKVALIGAGGAARAMAYGVVEKGADLTIYNRTIEKAEVLAQELGCESLGMDQLENIKNSDVIINSTSLGMKPNEDKSVVPIEYLSSSQIIFDAVYVPYETKLLKEAKEKGVKNIHGIDMLLYQGTAQFTLYTGEDAPEKTMRDSLLNHFGINE